MKVPAEFVVLSLALVASLSVVSVLAAPVKHEDSLELMETIKGDREPKPVRHHHWRHVPVPHIQLGRMNQAVIEPSKDTYTLLRSLRKVQGQDGRSPVCKICNMQSVDANTYDYFCLPDSEGMDGEICDRLTILGTTTAHRINVACKMLLSRHATMCK